MKFEENKHFINNQILGVQSDKQKKISKNNETTTQSKNKSNELVNTFVKGYSNYVNIDENKVNIIKQIEKVTGKPSSFANSTSVKDQQPIATVASTGELPSGTFQGQRDPIFSSTKASIKFVDLKDIVKYGSFFKGVTFTARGRLYSCRAKGNGAFIVLREQTHTLQAVGFVGDEKTPNMSKDFVKFIGSIPNESIVDVVGSLQSAKVDSCSIKEFELAISEVQVVSASTPVLPFQIKDANNSVLLDPNEEKEKEKTEDKEEGKKGKKDKKEKGQLQGKKEKEEQVINVNADTRLNQRWLDLRTSTSQAIMRVKTNVCRFYRDFLLAEDFIEIHTPKLIAGSSEGGSAVFQLKQFNVDACLAQSPQLQKQMAICSDLKRVFEIGPVFRAENSFTHRHLCEFTGVDLEMTFKEHYHEVLYFVFELFMHIFESLEKNCGKELDVIRQQYKAEPFTFCRPTPVLTYKEAIDMLIASGDNTAKYYEDLNTPQEKVLGALIKEKQKTDFQCIEKQPLCVRPFQTMPAPDQPLEMDGQQVPLSNSQDIFMRGEEIVSGAQRVHIPEMLEERCKALNMPTAGLKEYIDSFRQGCEPHAGVGIGLDRVVMLQCGLKNIRSSAMFPRDPKRIKP